MGVQDYTTLITSEHRGQPNFNALVNLLANGVGAVTTVIDSLPAAFDLDAAIAPQLDVDGQWIGQTRAVNGVLLIGFFGYSDDLSALGFGELGQPGVGGRFIELSDSTTAVALLSDPEYRTLLRAKILENNWNADVGSFEAALAEIVNTNNTGAAIPTQVFDPGTKLVSILTPTPIDPVAYALLTQYDIVPRAAGVAYQYLQPLSIPYAWSVAGTATASGTSVQKPTGTAAWDSSAYIAIPSNAVWVQWTWPNINAGQIMSGLAANPSGSPFLTSLNFGLLNNGRDVAVWEKDVFIQDFGSIAQPGDNYGVLWDKREAVYFRNPVGTTQWNVLRISKPAVSPGAVSPMFCLFSVNAQLATNVFIATGN
jgi:hypothetical protein